MTIGASTSPTGPEWSVKPRDGRVVMPREAVEAYRVTADDGIEFIRGSHEWGRMFMPLHFGEHTPKAPPTEEYEAIPDIDANRKRYDLITWEMEPGDCLMFSGLTVHGTPGRRGGPATGETIRRWTIRLVDAQATYRPRGVWTDETAAVLAAEGLREGQPLVCDLLPVLWRRQDYKGKVAK